MSKSMDDALLSLSCGCPVSQDEPAYDSDMIRDATTLEDVPFERDPSNDREVPESRWPESRWQPAPGSHDWYKAVRELLEVSEDYNHDVREVLAPILASRHLRLAPMSGSAMSGSGLAEEKREWPADELDLDKHPSQQPEELVPSEPLDLAGRPKDDASSALASAARPRHPKRWSTAAAGVLTQSDETDKVQFLMGTFYVQESDAQVTLQVLRLGRRQSPGTVRFKTIEGSAKAGTKFAETAGMVEFAPGEAEAEISIQLFQDSSWSATQEFQVELSLPEGMEKTLQLSDNLQVARIKIIDDDTFPSNRYHNALKLDRGLTEWPVLCGSRKGKAPHWGVFTEYYKANLKNPAVRRGSIKCFLADQISNGLSIARIFLMLLLVDELIHSKKLYQDDARTEDTHSPRLAAMGISMLLTSVIGYLLDYRRCFWKVGGASRIFLQSNILRRFLAYDDTSRAFVNNAHLMQSVCQQCDDMVTGYLQGFKIVKGIGMIVFLAAFQAARLGVMGLLPLGVLPWSVYAFMKLRSPATTRLLDAHKVAQLELLDHTQRYASHVSVLTDFSKRPDAVSRFETTVRKYNGATANKAAMIVNNSAFPYLLAELVVCVFMVFAGMFVITEDPSLNFLMRNATVSVFLATVGVFRQLGQAFCSMYGAVLQIQLVFPALEQIVTLLNIPTEDGRRMEESKLAAKLCKEAWEKARERNFSEEDKEYYQARHITRALDTIPIALKDVFFSYAGGGPSFVCDLVIRQGQMVAVVGDKADGKTTFMKVLAGRLSPSKGSVFVAPHLRVLNVSNEPLFFDRRNLLQNLCLGLPASELKNEARVRSLLERLGFEKQVLDMAAANGEPANWSQKLSVQQRMLLILARALVASPDVMLCHFPLRPFKMKARLHLIDVLREYVDARGICEDPQRYFLRHPRTLIFSAMDLTHDEVEYVDRVLQVKDGAVAEPDVFHVRAEKL